MFVNRKTYYCQDISSCYFDLQIQSNPNQNPIKLFCGYACVCVCVCAMLSCVRLFGTTWTIACQAPLSMEFSRQEQWSGLPFPTPGDLPNPGSEPMPFVSPVLAGGILSHWATWEAHTVFTFSGLSCGLNHMIWHLFTLSFLYIFHGLKAHLFFSAE